MKNTPKHVLYEPTPSHLHDFRSSAAGFQHWPPACIIISEKLHHGACVLAVGMKKKCRIRNLGGIIGGPLCTHAVCMWRGLQTACSYLCTRCACTKQGRMVYVHRACLHPTKDDVHAHGARRTCLHPIRVFLYIKNVSPLLQIRIFCLRFD